MAAEVGTPSAKMRRRVLSGSAGGAPVSACSWRGAYGAASGSHVWSGEAWAELPAACVALAWNAAGTCLVAADADGGVHFVGRSGALLFSQALPLGPKGRVSALAFALPALRDTEADEEAPEDLVIAVASPPRLARVSGVRVGLLRDARDAENAALLQSVRKSISVSWTELAAAHAGEPRAEAGPVGLVARARVRTGGLVVAAASADGILSSWSASRGGSSLSLAARAPAAGPVAQLAATSGGALAALYEDGAVRLWDMISLIPLGRVRLPEGLPPPTQMAALGAERGLLCLLAADGRLRVVKARPARCRQDTANILLEADEPAPAGSALVAGDDIAALLLVEDGQLQALECGVDEDGKAIVGVDAAEAPDAVLKSSLAAHLRTGQLDAGLVVLEQLAELDAPQHHDFIARSCVRLDLPPAQLRRVLEKAKVLCPASSDRLGEELYRLETFRLLHQDSSAPPAAGAWRAFREGNLDDALAAMLRAGSLDHAATLVQRHASALRLPDLELLPEELPPAWVRSCLGLLVRSAADKGQVLAWAARRGAALAPKAGLALVEAALAMEQAWTPAQQAARWAATEQQRALADLRRDLAEVVFLAEAHGLETTLEAFRAAQGHRGGCAVLLLERLVAPELVAGHLRRHTLPMAQRYGVDAEDLVLAYAERVAAAPSAAKERCAVEAVRLAVRQPRKIGQAALALMRGVRPPYSEELEALVQRAVAEADNGGGGGGGRKAGDEIREQRRLMALAARLRELRITQRLDLADAGQARALVQFLAARGPVDRALEIAAAFRTVDEGEVLAMALENIVLGANPVLIEPAAAAASASASASAEEEAGAREADGLAALARAAALLLERATVDTGQRRMLASGAVAFCELTLEDPETGDAEALRAATVGAAVALAPGANEQRRMFAVIRDMLRQFQVRLKPGDLRSREAFEAAFAAHVAGAPPEASAAEIVRRSRALHGEQRWDEGRQRGLRIVAARAARRGQRDEARRLARGCAAGTPSLDLAVELSLRLGPQLDLLAEAALRVPPGALPRAARLLRGASLTQQVLDRCADVGEATCWDDEDSGAGAVDDGLRGEVQLGWFQERERILSSATVRPLLLQALAGAPAPLQQATAYMEENGCSQLALRTLAVCACPAAGDIASRFDALLRQLAEKSLRAHPLDEELAVAYLGALSRDEEAFATFRASLPAVKRDYERLGRVARVGVDLGRRRTLMDLERDCKRLLRNAHWWAWLSRLRVPFDHSRFVDASHESQAEYTLALVPAALEASNWDHTAVARFAAAFAVEPEALQECVLREYLTRRGVDDWAALADVLAAAEQAVGRPALLGVLEQLFPRLDGRDLRLLRQVATRMGPAYRAKCEVLELLLATGCTLNFHALLGDQPWREIEAVLSSSTIQWLVALSDPLQLDPDDFYLCLLRKDLSRGQWAPEAALSQLDAVQSCTRALQLCEWAVTSAHVDDQQRVQLLEYAVKRARREGRPELEAQVQAALDRLETQLDLGALGIAVKEDEEPELLCRRLLQTYSHVAATEWQRPEQLHEAVGRIARRFGVNLVAIRKTLVLDWLSSADASEPAVLFLLEPNLGREEDRLRVVEFLVNFSARDDPSVTYRARARALSLSLQVGLEDAAREAVFERQSPFPGLSLSEYWTYCTYMIDFEELHLPRTMEQLIRCDKRGLIDTLWAQHRRDKRVVQLIANLIIDFRVTNDERITSAVVRQLGNLGLVKKQQHLVHCLQLDAGHQG